MNVTSNTPEAILGFKGIRLAGVIFEAVEDGDLTSSKVLVFENGYGLRIYDNGSYGVVNQSELAKLIRKRHSELKQTEDELRKVTELIGFSV